MVTKLLSIEHRQFAAAATGHETPDKHFLDRDFADSDTIYCFIWIIQRRHDESFGVLGYFI
jgi:hypothetical protein